MDHTYRTVGKSIPRKDARDKVTGSPVFCADLDLKDPLALRVLRSRKSHAEILGIDPSGALKIPGVVAVFTAADIPGRNRLGIINKDQPLLAVDKVRSTGDAVALIAAESAARAQQALDAITVTYKELPAVFSPEEALTPDAPRIHSKGNLLTTRIIRHGDAEAAFSSCFHVTEKTYCTSFVEHNYLEPDAAAGLVEKNGTLVVYASTQNPHYDHKELVSLLGLDDDRVRLIQAVTGGGFGSKLDLGITGFVALALYHLKKPVRYVYSREEAYLATAKRHPLTITLKSGTDEHGRLLALKARIVCDTGAYGSYGVAVATRSAVHATGPYRVEHVDIESHAVYTNNPFCGAFRGFGAPQIAFAYESQMDVHAKALGMDPLALRKLNALQIGNTTACGQRLTASVGMSSCLDALQPHYEAAGTGWKQRVKSPFKRRGIGIGAMWFGIGNTGVQNPSTARIEITPEGIVTLYTGCADIGQGSTTVLSQITAEILGLDVENIRTVVADTARTTNAGATSASRQTYISGNAVRQATEKLAEVLMTEAVNLLKVRKNKLILTDGHVAVANQPDRRASLAQLAKRLHAKGAPLVWPGYFDPETVPLDPETGQGVPYGTYAYAAQMALVEVDTLTGEVCVEKIVAAHDVGHAIHPENVIGQICGGVAMGMGFALMEEFEPGKTLSMKDYHIPTIADMPEVVPIIVEQREPTGPFGAKGVGEPSLVPTAPAVINAIADALGHRIYALPASLERVLAACMASDRHDKRTATTGLPVAFLKNP